MKKLGIAILGCVFALSMTSCKKAEKKADEDKGGSMTAEDMMAADEMADDMGMPAEDMMAADDMGTAAGDMGAGTDQWATPCWTALIDRPVPQRRKPARYPADPM